MKYSSSAPFSASSTSCESVCVFVCGNEREREKESVRVCACFCTSGGREREREKGRKIERETRKRERKQEREVARERERERGEGEGVRAREREGELALQLRLIRCGHKNRANCKEAVARFGGPWPSWELALTMNWVDRLRTSADKWMWSGRHAVVMRTGRRAELLGVKLGCPRSRCRAVVSDVLCVR